jgi:cellulase (glycosyl hydrolase family 5)
VSDTELESFLLGVNFHGFGCASHQNNSRDPKPPKAYMADSFKIFKEAGIQCIRFPLYWESYEKNSEEFIEELDNVSSIAEEYDISCIYDNHQWECSSYLGEGIGFPNSLLINSFEPDPNSSRKPSIQQLKKFWDGWWDRKLKTTEGKDAWDAQLEFILEVRKRVKNKNSTLGFEVLNEPQVFRQADFRKVGNYHDHIIKNVSIITDKPLFFCFTFSAAPGVINLPWEQAKAKPSTNVGNNTIFDVHPYPPNLLTMGYYKRLSTLMDNVTIYVGEFNAGTRKWVTINERKFKKYIKRLKKFKVYGAAFWEWSYKVDDTHPAFNLTKVINDKIYPNRNFENFFAFDI